MDSPPDFGRLTVRELQDFLREKGVSTTGYTKAKLVKLAAAVTELNLPNDPDLAGPSHSVDATLQRKLQLAGCDFVSDPCSLPGFTTDFRGRAFSSHEMLRTNIWFRKSYESNTLHMRSVSIARIVITSPITTMFPHLLETFMEIFSASNFTNNGF